MGFLKIPAKSRIKLLLGGVATLAMLVATSVWFILESGVDSPLPNPNGFDCLVQAALSTQYSFEDPYALDRTELESIVRGNQSALDLARRGLAMPGRVPWPANLAEALGSRQTQLSALKALAQPFLVECRLREVLDQPAAAVQCCLDVVRLGAGLCRGGREIEYLVGTSIMNIGAAHAVKLAGQLDPVSCRAAAATIDQELRHLPAFAEVETTDRRFLARHGSFKTKLLRPLAAWFPAERRRIARVRARAQSGVAQLRQHAAALLRHAGTLEQEQAKR